MSTPRWPAVPAFTTPQARQRPSTSLPARTLTTPTTLSTQCPSHSLSARIHCLPHNLQLAPVQSSLTAPPSNSVHPGTPNQPLICTVVGTSMQGATTTVPPTAASSCAAATKDSLPASANPAINSQSGILPEPSTSQPPLPILLASLPPDTQTPSPSPPTSQPLLQPPPTTPPPDLTPLLGTPEDLTDAHLSVPDDQLLALVCSGALSDPATLPSLPDHQLLALACSGALSGPATPLSSVRAALQAAVRAAEALAARRDVDNASRLAGRVRRDLGFLDRCLTGIAAVGGEHVGISIATVDASATGDTTQGAIVGISGGDVSATGNGNSGTGETTQGASAVVSNDIGSGADVATAATTGATAVAATTATPAATTATATTALTAPTATTTATVTATATTATATTATPAATATTATPTATAAATTAATSATASTASRMIKALTPARIQGLANNLRGYAGEILAAQLAPGVVAVGKRFHAIPCQATPAPGAAHGAVVAARRQEVEDRRRQQQQDSRAARQQQEQQGSGAARQQQDSRAARQQQEQQGSGAADGVTGSLSEAVDGDDDQKRNISGDDGVQGGGDGQQSGGGPGVKGKSKGGSGSSRMLLLSAEVDVVCQGGSVWLEVKNQEEFSVDSEHWSSNKGGMKGLCRQVEEMLLVAAAPCNHVRWCPPRVAVLFPSGADPSVVEALKVMGVHVLLGLDALPAGLPSAPPEPSVTNLDTTTMCALCSQVSWARQPQGGLDPQVVAWAARIAQWRECVADEEKSPLIPQLSRYVAAGRRVVAADVAVDQFETLVGMFGGPKEQARWHELRSRLEVIPTRGQEDAAANVSHGLTTLGALKEVGEQQVAVFGVGDRLRAVTLTANGAAVRSADRQGVRLEAVVHRAVWLSGL